MKNFAEMTREEKRVAVAEDVIAQVRAKRLAAQRGVYVAAYVGETDDMIPTEVALGADKARPAADVLPTCRACAVGSMVLALLNLDRSRVDQVAKLVDESYERCYGPVTYLSSVDRDGFWIGGEVSKRELGDIFSRVELELIEDAFELSDVYDCEPEDALLIVMKRVVDAAGGEFVISAREVGDLARVDA